MKVDHLSLLTTPIILLKGDTRVSQGTGFYYVQPDSEKKLSAVFLVTNFHVLTGSSPSEKKPPIGDNIIFYCHQDENTPGKVKQLRLPLFTKKNDPIWIASKEFPNADIGIIPLPSGLIADCKIYGISEEWAGGDIAVRPTSTVTLLGYPYGYFDTVNFLPIWKTGSVASEPKFDFEGKPLFLVDISAFPGMSGAPAFAIAHGTYQTEDGNTAVGSSIRKFLGIYASMQMLTEKKFLEQIESGKKPGVVLSESLQIGHIWKAQLLINMIKSIDVPKYEKEILGNLR